ncbi:hypothetical protein HAX54_050097 [Datura stramonium]|uniref:Uncharacterized protein n=1 Tax=Datura stramonium TaxID=4076 RepID=A0ABS8WPX5_DATST|nr:hypothetical protein [Datura stramonium]
MTSWDIMGGSYKVTGEEVHHQVDIVSFVEDEEKPNSEAPSLTPPDSVTEASSPSPDATSDSAAQLMHGIPGQTM